MEEIKGGGQKPCQKSDYITRLWQILPQWLKNIPRAIRSQWHGDFCDEFERRENMLLLRFNEQSLALKQLNGEAERRDDLFQQQLAEQAMALKQLGERLEKTGALIRSEIQQLPLVTQEQWRALQQVCTQSFTAVKFADRLLSEACIPVMERNFQDVRIILNRLSPFLPAVPFIVKTDHPVAIDSVDHKMPRGTRNDNTRSPRFVSACERHFPHTEISFLDCGCAGGGLVWDFVLKGHKAVGLEGSDFSKLAERAEWRLLGGLNLFTADVAKNFEVFMPAGEPFQAHVISAWELLEHLAEADLPVFFDNIRRHLNPQGFFVGSIATKSDKDGDVEYHQTQKPKQWWADEFKRAGLIFTDDHSFEQPDYVRGSSNAMYDWDSSAPDPYGFHFVAKLTI